jgi:hypothetical protein
LYIQAIKEDKLKQHQKMIDSAALSLISRRSTVHEDLIKNFENSQSTFDNKIFSEDHVRERAKERIEKKKQIENTFHGKRKLNILHDKRIEIVDYYEMNDNLIKKNNTITLGEDNEKLFKDLKKINIIVLNDIKAQNQENKRLGKEKGTVSRNESNKRAVNTSKSLNRSPKVESVTIKKSPTSADIKRNENSHKNNNTKNKTFIHSKSPMKFTI